MIKFWCSLHEKMAIPIDVIKQSKCLYGRQKKLHMSNVLTEYLLLFFAVLINNNNHVTHFVHSNKNQK